MVGALMRSSPEVSTYSISATAMAGAEIEYVDTSGEVIDQSADHLRRLRQFEASLEATWRRAESYKRRHGLSAELAVSMGDIKADQLVGKAQAAGATYQMVVVWPRLSCVLLLISVPLLGLFHFRDGKSLAAPLFQANHVEECFFAPQRSPWARPGRRAGHARRRRWLACGASVNPRRRTSGILGRATASNT